MNEYIYDNNIFYKYTKKYQMIKNNLYFFQMYGTPQNWTVNRALNYLFLILRYTFWYFVTELMLHYLYFSAFRYQPDIVKKFDMWTLSGLGYTMGQFFCLKYIFFYGISRPFVMSDGIEPPNHPKCIGRIHLYSDMWRYFDSGLYKFMHRYYYFYFVLKCFVTNI